MLVDQATIYVKAGDGGHGCVSFRREKYVPKGGPDGGDGGHGGSVYAEATPGVDTLLDFAGRHHWYAEKGHAGQGKNMTGRSGEDLVLRLPAGTQIYDRDTGVLLKDLDTLRERICIAEGGRGGKGNARFASPTHQVPTEFEEGQPGQERWLRLELKLIADVALVGLPNAGKSTLLSRVSRARPKVAAYPFTTLQPNLGIVRVGGDRTFVMADIPGLIEGAHEGAGLGDEFLRHIERTRVLLHLVDVAGPYASMPAVQAYHTIRAELTKHSGELASKPEVIVATKIDVTGGEEAAGELAQAIGKPVTPISAVTGKGLPGLLEQLWSLIQRVKEPDVAEEPVPVDLPTPPHRRPS